jgi:hypothetical protein
MKKFKFGYGKYWCFNSDNNFFQMVILPNLLFARYDAEFLITLEWLIWHVQITIMLNDKNFSND